MTGVGCSCGWPLDPCNPAYCDDGLCDRIRQEVIQGDRVIGTNLVDDLKMITTPEVQASFARLALMAYGPYLRVADPDAFAYFSARAGE